MGVDPCDALCLTDEGSMVTLIPPECFSKATETTEQVFEPNRGKQQSNMMHLPSKGV